jgi:hypothetical protein
MLKLGIMIVYTNKDIGLRMLSATQSCIYVLRLIQLQPKRTITIFCFDCLNRLYDELDCKYYFPVLS